MWVLGTRRPKMHRMRTTKNPKKKSKKTKSALKRARTNERAKEEVASAEVPAVVEKEEEGKVEKRSVHGPTTMQSKFK